LRGHRRARCPAARRHLARVGHCEFGHGRHPTHRATPDTADEIRVLWQARCKAEGWAVQSAELYGLIAAEIESDKALAQAILVLRYEDLVAAPAETMRRILDHASLDADEAILRKADARLRLPTDHRPQIPAAEAEAIHERTASVAACFGHA
jgi:crotonobetainyl-CoA:carnitine CoA-transferase CaiB-like acyl-CoA transferase